MRVSLIYNRGIMRGVANFAALVIVVAILALSASAQSLNWEGQTGVFVTPLAYTAGSPKDGIGKPIVAYHYLDTGNVIGGFHMASATVGVASRIEFGYTHAFHRSGNTPGLSPLWRGGFNIVHGKANLVPEDTGGQKWLPAISAGFVARSQNPNVSGTLAVPVQDYNSADFYLVATKTIAQIKPLPVLLSFGYKVTNASVLGLVGNAPAYKGRAFGAAAVVVKGPAGSTLIFASEAAQQVPQVRNLPGVIVPTTLVYAVRIVPTEAAKLNIDFGVAQVAGKIAPGVDVKSRNQFGMGISYGF